MLGSCKECLADTLEINYSEGNVVCRSSGLLQSSRIIEECAEWRNFAKESSSRGGDDPKRVGEANNDLLPDRGICTIISNAKDSNLARWGQRFIQGSVEKTLSDAFRAIDDLCNNLELGDVVKEEAKKLFKDVENKKILKGKRGNAVACVFIACRTKDNPRSIREISNVSGHEVKDILKCFALIKKNIELKHTNKSAAEYTRRYARELGLSETATFYAQRIANTSIDKGFVTGKSPLSVASAAVYMVGKLSGDIRNYNSRIGKHDTAN